MTDGTDSDPWQLEAFARSLTSVGERTTAAYLADLRGFVWDGGATSEALRGYHASMCFADPRTFHRHARELVELSEPETMAVRLAHLPVPVTYVAGAPDGACARSRDLLDGAGVATIEIAPAGHWPFIDQPGVFAGAVATLL